MKEFQLSNSQGVKKWKFILRFLNNKKNCKNYIQNFGLSCKPKPVEILNSITINQNCHYFLYVAVYQ